MRVSRDTMLLYAVTDRSWTDKMSLKEQVEAALSGGATLIQLREKELPEELFLQEAIEIKKVCEKYNVPLIINDNVDVAVKAGASGVHVGQEDMNAENVRALAGEGFIIGVTAHNLEEAAAAEKAGADYLGVGAVFSTSTKTNTRPITIDELKRICDTVSIPVAAIGGINKNNMTKLSGSGIAGVALVSAIFAASDIEKECRELKELAGKVTGK